MNENDRNKIYVETTDIKKKIKIYRKRNIIMKDINNILLNTQMNLSLVICYIQDAILYLSTENSNKKIIDINKNELIFHLNETINLIYNIFEEMRETHEQL